MQTIAQAPPKRGGQGLRRISILAPADGAELGPDDPPIVVVEGRVSDSRVSQVSLLANRARITLPVREGKFRHVLPVLEPTLRLVAEAPMEAGGTQASEPVTVRLAAPVGRVGVLTFDWPSTAVGGTVEIVATHRASPGRMDVSARPVAVRALAGRTPPEAVYLKNLQPGVYAIWLRTSAALAGPLSVVLHLSDGASVQTRALPPLPASASGRWILARLLYPQGVLWEQDDWFTGRSESAETITKFRFPEGIRWTERKADLR